MKQTIKPKRVVRRNGFLGVLLIIQRHVLAPEAVDELKMEDKSVDNHQDNVELDVELNWKSPCTSNGKLMLILELNGQYTEDPTNTQSQNFSIEGTTQNFDVSKYLKYSYDYNATIISSNEEGEGGKNTIAFKTSANCKSNCFTTELLSIKICTHFRSW